MHSAIAEKRLPATALTAAIPDILQKLKLLVNGKLTNAALVLFCKKEDKQFLHCSVQLARFKGIDKSEFLDSKMFIANIFDLHDKAMDFLSFHLPVAARIENGNPNRIETPAIPYKVLREALTNALIHRAFSMYGSTYIAVYDDRVNITNMGSLPGGIQLNQLTKVHPSVPRNPTIAHVFYLCGKIEKWGRGTLDMIQESKKCGNPTPKYEEIGGTFSVTLPLKEPLRSFESKQRFGYEFDGLTKRQKDILNILLHEPLSRKQLTAKMNDDLKGRTLQTELHKLKAMGIIRAVGKARALVWHANKVESRNKIAPKSRNDNFMKLRIERANLSY